IKSDDGHPRSKASHRLSEFGWTEAHGVSEVFPAATAYISTAVAREDQPVQSPGFDNYLGRRAVCVGVGSPTLFRPVRSNNPAASTANEDHQKKYPIPRPNPQPFQCALKAKATAAAHAENRLSS